MKSVNMLIDFTSLSPFSLSFSWTSISNFTISFTPFFVGSSSYIAFRTVNFTGPSSTVGLNWLKKIVFSFLLIIFSSNFFLRQSSVCRYSWQDHFYFFLKFYFYLFYKLIKIHVFFY